MTLLLGGHAIDCRIVDEYHEVAMSMSEHEQLQSCGVLCVCMATIKIYVVVVRKTFIIWDESPYFVSDLVFFAIVIGFFGGADTDKV